MQRKFTFCGWMSDICSRIPALPSQWLWTYVYWHDFTPLISVGGTTSLKRSSFIMSTAVCINELPYFEMDVDGEFFQGSKDKDVPQYSLREIAEHYHVNCDNLIEKCCSQANEIITTHCVQCICDSIGQGQLWGAELKHLHPMVSSVKQRPDIAVYFED